jgi:hypothetical protein
MFEDDYNNGMNVEVPTFGDWFDSFFNGAAPFSKSWIRYNRPLHEVDGYKVYPAKGNPNGLIVVVNTAGIQAKDVSVTCTQSKTLHICGKTTIDAIGETNSVDISLKINVVNPIEKIASKTIDGYTYIYMLFKSKDAEAVKVTSLEDNHDFFELEDKKADSKADTKSEAKPSK